MLATYLKKEQQYLRMIADIVVDPRGLALLFQGRHDSISELALARETAFPQYRRHKCTWQALELVLNNEEIYAESLSPVKRYQILEATATNRELVEHSVDQMFRRAGELPGLPVRQEIGVDNAYVAGHHRRVLQCLQEEKIYPEPLMLDMACIYAALYNHLYPSQLQPDLDMCWSLTSVRACYMTRYMLQECPVCSIENRDGGRRCEVRQVTRTELFSLEYAELMDADECFGEPGP